MSTKTTHLQSAGSFYHIYNRGANRGPIFFERRNYYYFLERMIEYHDPASMEIVAYCLMPNHFHFLVRQNIPFGTTKFFKGVCGGYVRAINNAYGRSGHLFEGKFKMKVVDTDEYLLHLSRYIHLNPVRAGMVSAPEDWEFSSFRTMDKNAGELLLHSEYILRQTNGLEGYAKFVNEYEPGGKKKIEGVLH